MIRRDDGDSWLLISQVDHAHLAANVATVWEHEGVPLPENLIAAIRDHDDGWSDWERSPTVDPATRRPRDFTEMPLDTSTAIWAGSVEICRHGRRSMVPTLHEFRRFLAGEGRRLTHDRAIVAEEVFSTQEPFEADMLYQQLPVRDDGKRVPRKTFDRTLAAMQRAGLIEKVSLGGRSDGYRQTRRLEAGSELGGVWVSRHFCRLARQAIEHRSDQPNEVAAGQQFIKEQSRLQDHWLVEAAEVTGRGDVEELADWGCDILQFFDRLSLWLCCAPRSETASWSFPQRGTVHFTPLADGQVAVEPFPLAVETLSLSVSARRLPAQPVDDAALRERLATAPVEQLQWQLVKW